MSDYTTIPPISMPLVDPDGAGSLTQKEWYRFWASLGLGVNALSDALQFGPMEDMPDPAGVPRGSLYLVNDPGYVIYQNLDDGWHYVTGTMWGTLVPDERPTGLGVNDAGFDFRTTDTPAHEFIWSGLAWIDATPVLRGTHAARPAAVTVADGTLYIETDRGNVIYQLRLGQWVYAAGSMAGTISPDQRPGGLGVNDTGFQFQATDTLHTYRWSGSAWVDLTPSSTPQNVALYGQATSAVTLTASFQNVPGCSLTLSRAGVYLVQGIFDFISTNDAGQTFIGQIAGFSPAAIFVTNTTQARATVAQNWFMSVSAGYVATLQIAKTGGTGTSSASTNTTISALWVSP